MPFYLRKAISTGPFRFSLSNSGIGLSVGVKGLRFGIGPRGNYIHAVRGGLYYRTSLSRAGQKVRQPPPSQDGGAGLPPTPLPPPVHQEPVEMVEINSGDVLAMRDARFGELLDEINSKQRQIAYATIFGVVVGAVGLGVLCLGSQVVPYLDSQVGVYVLLLALPAWAIGRWVDSYKRRSVLFYDLDQDAAKAYEAMTHAFDEMMSCAGNWHIEAKSDLKTWKRNAGATNLIQLKPAQLSYATPKIIASNITPPSARLGRQTAYFFPDAAFVIDGKRVGVISYDDLSISAQDYEVAQFSSSSGLNELLEFSRTGVVAPFANAIKNLSLRLGRQAAHKQSPSPAAAEEAREPKPVRLSAAPQLDLRSIQKAHQMLVDTKADFFKRFKESPNLSDELVGLRETVFSNFDYLVTAALCTIAGADGPINGKEAEVINSLLGIQQNEISYNNFLTSMHDINVSRMFANIIGVAILLGGKELVNKYDPKNDPIVKCFEALGQAVVSADGNVSQSELACLSKFTAIAPSTAADIARSLQSRTDARASDAPQYAPVTNQTSTTQSQSVAIVSGDGSYRFEVVGESQYQADLERIVGGRIKDSASYQCVGILTPEPDNPYDRLAVYVSVDDRKVAYLTQDWAALFKAVLASNGYAQAACNALIVGGWDRGGNDRGDFGIKLDITFPLDLKPTALRPELIHPPALAGHG